MKMVVHGCMPSLHNEFLIYFFNCKWNRETGHLLTTISNFLQFNNKKHFLQCKVKYNDEKIKISDGYYFKLLCNFFTNLEAAGSRSLWKQRPYQEKLKKLKEAISLSLCKRYFRYVIGKNVSLRRNFSKALFMLSWFCYYFY